MPDKSHKTTSSAISTSSVTATTTATIKTGQEEVNGGVNGQQEQSMAKLIIEQPRLSDEALYKCDVTYVKGKCPSISLVKVQMMALPQKAQIILIPSGNGNSNSHTQSSMEPTTNNHQLDDGQLIGPLNEHEQLRLICRVIGGRPQPKSIIWRKIDPSGRRINLQHEQTRPIIQRTMMAGSGHSLSSQMQNVVEVYLNHTLTSADLGAKFECHVEHEALDELPIMRLPSTSSSSQNRHHQQQQQPDSLLDLHPSKPIAASAFSTQEDSEEDHENGLPPTKQSLDSHVLLDLNVGVSSLDLFMSRVNKRNSSEPLKEGDLVELECIAYNSKPPANISWFNGAEPIEQLIDLPPTPLSNNLPTSQLSQTQTARSQRQRRLLQRNQVNRNNDGLTYNTHSFLSIKLSRHEHRALISCQAHWQLNPSTSSDSGRQPQAAAVAVASMLRPMSKSLELQVQHAPIVLMEPAGGISVNEQLNLNHHHTATSSQVVTAAVAAGSENNVIAQQQQSKAPPVSIYCIYSANPIELAPNSTRWFKDGQQLQINHHHHQEEEEEGEGHASHLSESLTATGYPVLNINQVSRKDAGRYDCQLSNSVGSSERLPSSEAARLEVNFRPTVRLRLFKPNNNAVHTSSNINNNNNNRQVLFDQQQASFQIEELVEIDPGEELILPGQTYVLVCDVLEARPNKIEKFHWFRKSPFGQQQQQQQPYQLIGASEANQFVLSSLATNFSPASYACAASNALGPSDNSNQLELQLSYSPGPSIVKPVRDAALRKQVLQQSGEMEDGSIDSPDSISADTQSSTAPLAAGKKILLECITQDPGRPRANTWLWFKNGQPIDSKSLISANNNNSNSNPSNYVRDLILDDNPISGLDLDQRINGGLIQRRNQHRSIGSSIKNELAPSLQENEETDSSRTTISGIASGRELLELAEKMKILSSGRYLFIPSIQLSHKGNYSCVAFNRFGSGLQQQQQQQESSSSPSSSNHVERDSYNFNVALAPSFIQPLPARTYWQEISSSSSSGNIKPTPPPSSSTSSGDGQLMIMELVCHVQCDPMCNVEWLRNGQPIDLKGKWQQQQHQAEENGSNYVSYQIRQSILDENLEANLFKSIESRLILRIADKHMGSGNTEQSLGAMFARERVLTRRAYLNSSNYTCQSTPNSMGPGVRSTSKFVVQYPPKNVLINAPSDNLSLVEGSNGPRLSCEASGEPQIQYRWLLSRSSGTDLATSKYTNQVKRSSSLTSTGGELLQVVSDNEQDHTINQLAPTRRVNDLPSTTSIPDGGNYIELAGSISEQRGVTISTLDLSQLSLDRKQSGHYVCEASNKLGQSKQSVYVNVLYKPTCSGLHLHSLDMLMAPPNDIKQQTNADMRIKPLRASPNDEYTLVRENSDDFINLRKTLVISPLLYGHLTGNTHTYGGSEFGELSLKGSIFQSILDDRRSSVSISGGLAKDKDALIHNDNTDLGESPNALPSHDDLKRPNQDDSSLAGIKSAKSASAGDAWNRFNTLLLKFLNTYVRQVKNQQDTLIFESPRKDPSSRDKRQNPRGSSSSSSKFGDPAERLSRADSELNNPPPTPMVYHHHQGRPEVQASATTKNLLTFACMAQDGNPMGNLSFDWSFGSISLPEYSGYDPIDLESRQPDSDEGSSTRYGPAVYPKEAQLIYVNSNRTVSVELVRRFDTRSTLNPFQMSLITINVKINQRYHQPGVVETSLEGNKISKRNAEVAYNTVPPNERYSASQAKAPVIRNRSYNGNNNNNNPRVNQNHGQHQQQQQQQNTNIQFANEFEAKPEISSSYQVELDEYNWQENLGSLLSCRVSNQIGTSDVCHVRVNLVERLKSLSSSESEFAKWRMPSLAQKSLLIVSILVGCALIVFSASALLIGPYLRSLSYKSSETGGGGVHETGVENNTRQSTSSQKSSVLGLLTNGDSSLQGSSDEDSNGRSNLTDPDNGPHNDSLQPLDLGGSSLSGIVSSCGYRTASGAGHNHYQTGQIMRGGENLVANYDEPRSRLQARAAATYQNGAFSEQTPDRIGGTTSHYLESLALSGGDNNNKVNKQRRAADSAELPSHRTSAGSKLLASLKLKSLSKFKVDKVSDQANLASHLADLKSYHARSVSGSGTNTTGMSNLCIDSDVSLSLTPPNVSGSKYFGSSAFRHSYTNARRTATNQSSIADNSTQHQRYNGNPVSQPSMHELLLAQRYAAESQTVTSMMPTYSNLNNYDSYNAMDEFIRRKELESSLEQGGGSSSGFVRTHSNRYRGQQTNAIPAIAVPTPTRIDLNNLYSPQMVRQQPYYYSGQPQSMTLQRSNNRLASEHKPPVAARPLHRFINQDPAASMQQYQIPANNNRFSMPAIAQIPTVNSNTKTANTIDSHLDNFANSLAVGQYPNSSGRLAPTPIDAKEIRQSAQSIYGNYNQRNQRSTEHIYDVNAYATPEQTPQRRGGPINNNHIANDAQNIETPRSRVCQLIQTFNSSLPE